MSISIKAVKRILNEEKRKYLEGIEQLEEEVDLEKQECNRQPCYTYLEYLEHQMDEHTSKINLLIRIEKKIEGKVRK